MLKTIAIIIGIIIGLVLLAVVGFLALRYYQNRNIKDTKNLQSLVEKVGGEYVAKQGNVGLVIGVVKGERVFIKGFGATKKENGAVPNEKTIFELASVGKTFTTSTAQILADRAEISFDDTLEKHLGAKVKLCEQVKKITLRQLATHTSGIPSIPESFFPKMKDELDPYKDLVVQDLYDYLSECGGIEPGGSYSYSNTGMGVLGHILELKTEKSYETLVKEELTEKLGMTNTTIALTDEQKKLLAQGYNEQGNPNPVWEDKVLTGAGSFLSNAEDMIKFIKANFDENESEISPSLLKTHARQFDGKTGLGWHHNSKFFGFITNDKNSLWHNGGAGGYASYVGFDKETKSGVIVLSNSTDDVTPIGARLNFFARHISFSND